MIEQVFGKTLVCKNLDVATDAGRTTDLNCVTIEGDQVGKKGTLTGGFLDAARYIGFFSSLGRGEGEWESSSSIVEVLFLCYRLVGFIFNQDIKYIDVNKYDK